MVGFPTDRCSFLFHYLGRNHINFQCGKGGRFTKGNAVNYLLPAAILAAFLNPILASDTLSNISVIEFTQMEIFENGVVFRKNQGNSLSKMHSLKCCSFCAGHPSESSEIQWHIPREINNLLVNNR